MSVTQALFQAPKLFIPCKTVLSEVWRWVNYLLKSYSLHNVFIFAKNLI